MICFKCKKEFQLDSIHRTSECPFCGTDLHVCLNCRFYAPGSHFDCRETVDDYVTDKDRANFCDSFSLKADAAGQNVTGQRDKAADDFAALFGEKASGKKAGGNGADAFNALFG